MQGELFHGMEKNIRHSEEFEDEKPVEKSSIFERLQFTLTFDKMVIASISMVVLLAITFAMGVERGKQKAAQIAAQTSGELAGKTIIQQEWSARSQESTDPSSGTTLVSESTESSVPSSDFDSMNGLVSASTSLDQTSTAIQPHDLSPQAKKLTDATMSPSAVSKKAIDAQNKKYTVRLASYLKKTQANSAADRLKKKGYDTFVKQSGKYFVLNVGRFDAKQAAQDTLGRLRKELKMPKEGFVLSA